MSYEIPKITDSPEEVEDKTDSDHSSGSGGGGGSGGLNLPTDPLGTMPDSVDDNLPDLPDPSGGSDSSDSGGLSGDAGSGVGGDSSDSDGSDSSDSSGPDSSDSGGGLNLGEQIPNPSGTQRLDGAFTGGSDNSDGSSDNSEDKSSGDSDGGLGTDSDGSSDPNLMDEEWVALDPFETMPDSVTENLPDPGDSGGSSSDSGQSDTPQSAGLLAGIDQRQVAIGAAALAVVWGVSQR
ncbi:hypothetical protein [Halapricum desulfuricans]|uniref:Uncharacterized protein n=1 Tax=Halapricum desulfuricans TaxID=2841257 RepID=A0A897N0K8_9EURY|nr:hypothetical protein [Halapricum desulfuricans]QSG06472.1 hypothetical protein HSR121_2141 [Halapricum desulfuricans]